MAKWIGIYCKTCGVKLHEENSRSITCSKCKEVAYEKRLESQHNRIAQKKLEAKTDYLLKKGDKNEIC